MSAELIIGMVFSLLGLLLVAIAVFIWIRTRAFMSTAQEVKGTVTGLDIKFWFRGGHSVCACLQIHHDTGTGC